MKSVYLVSSGCYSSWSIRGIFSTPELAELFKPTVEDVNDHVEVWTIDEWADLAKQGLSTFLVWSKEGAIDVDWASQMPAEYGRGAMDVECFPDKNIMRIFVHARNEEHAIKIAADKFREYKATHG